MNVKEKIKIVEEISKKSDHKEILVLNEDSLGIAVLSLYKPNRIKF